jgi:sugar phosphate isomerase/epimerase
MSALPIGICSFSFHRLLAEGRQDIFQYILDCKELGATQLDPWNAHLAPIRSGDDVLHAGHNPDDSMHLEAQDVEYIDRVKAAADEAGLPFGCIAVDGAHIYEADPDKRAANRARAYRWLNVAQRLGAQQMRIDSGGAAELNDEELAVIVEGYRDLIDRAKPAGIQIVVENHWGPTTDPDQLLRLLDAVPGLGFLHDLHNWRPEVRDRGRRLLADRSDCLHVKTFAFDETGDDPDEKAREGLQLLKDAGYRGAWGVESVPRDGNEIDGARRTIELIRSVAGA